MNSKVHLLLLTVAAGFLFLMNLTGYDLWSPDEPRFAQVAREMMQSGDYLSPHINDHPYMEKPPLLFWAQVICAIPFGDVTELAARLPSVVAGILTVLMTYLLVRRLYDPRTAFWAALMLMTTHRFWWQARFGQIDMLLTACMTAVMLFFWMWYQERNRIFLVFFYFAIAAGMLAKGPPALVFPLLMILMFFWRRKEERKQLHLLLGVTGVIVLVALWLIPARMAVSIPSSGDVSQGIASNLFRQTIGRFFIGVAHANPPWYYLLKLPFDLFPWSLFLPWTCTWAWKRRKEQDETRFLISWILPAFIFFSISIGKRGVYLLPMYPAFAALFAPSILAFMDAEIHVWRKRIGIVFGSLLILAAIVPYYLRYSGELPVWSSIFIPLSAVALVCGVYGIWYATHSDGRRLHLYVFVGYALIATCIATFGLPVLNASKSAKAFCTPMRQLSRAGVDFELYSLILSREEYIYYSEHFNTTVPDGSLKIAGMEDYSALEQLTFQGETLYAIQKAVEKVEIGDAHKVSDEDIQRLLEAMDGALNNASQEKQIISGFRTAMSLELSALHEKMQGDTPSFIMMQDREWRWAVALCPEIRALTVLHDTLVDSKHVLLLGNEEAVRLAQARGEVAHP